MNRNKDNERTKRQVIRLLKMEERLIQLGRVGASATELADHFGVNRRTIYRDLETLQELGMPIYTDESRFYILAGYVVPAYRPLQISPSNEPQQPQVTFSDWIDRLLAALLLEFEIMEYQGLPTPSLMDQTLVRATPETIRAVMVESLSGQPLPRNKPPVQVPTGPAPSPAPENSEAAARADLVRKVENMESDPIMRNSRALVAARAALQNFDKERNEETIQYMIADMLENGEASEAARIDSE